MEKNTVLRIKFKINKSAKKHVFKIMKRNDTLLKRLKDL